jgi:hypothetical protein
MNERKDNLTGHGSASDRGAADKYYWRPCNPHYYEGATASSKRVEKKDMMPEEIAAYEKAYEEETDRKEWD